MDKERPLCEKIPDDVHGHREAIAFDGMFVSFYVVKFNYLWIYSKRVWIYI